MESSARVWSSFQLAIFAEVAEGEGHTVVLARAGTGKTTTIMEALRHIPAGKTSLVCAFNKSIETELAQRVADAKLSTVVKTLHAFGSNACWRAFGSKLNKFKMRDILEKLVPGDKHRELRDEMHRCASLCKGNLVEHGDLDAVDGICTDYDIDAGNEADERREFCETVMQALSLAAANKKEIDFDDMIWFPYVHELNVPKFDRVFVDETQDLNAAQIELTLAACAEGGRICVVGDDRQAIYGFRGADSSAIRKLTDRLDAKVLPLSVTYRCAKKIVELAKTIVEDYESAPGAIDGEIVEASDAMMVAGATSGDFILSRTNAPLVKYCLALLAKGIPAAIQGRDVSAQLLKVVNKSKAKTIPDLAEWLRGWERREIERMKKRDPDADTTRVEDTASCIDAICEGESSIAAVVAKIQGLFSDTDETRRVTLSTTHKAKGLERDRVWLLKDTYRPGRGTEEANLWYVAVTRAKSTLFMVTTKKETSLAEKMA